MTSKAGETTTDVTIVGAGIIGIVTGLQLQRRGYTVTLVDRQDAAQGCSAGNAGILATYGISPLSLPGILRKVPAMLADPLGPLSIRRSHLFRLAPWIWRFWRASRPDSVEQISAALSNLVGPSVDEYSALTRDAAVEPIITQSPLLCVYKNRQAYEGDSFLWGLRGRHGVEWELLCGSEVRSLEPSLNKHYQFAASIRNTAFALDPQRLALALFNAFMNNGGRFKRAKVFDIEIKDMKPSALQTDTEKMAVKEVVIACGAWSGQLSKRMGESVPLEQERGYHVTLSNFQGTAPRHPIMSPAHKVIATPMEMGLRVAGMAEFAGFAPPEPRRNEVLRNHLNHLFPEIQGGAIATWMGHRPTLPDSLPVISPSKRYRSLFYAFGHHHIGLTSAPVTGKLIAEMISGAKASIDIDAYRIDRF